MKTFATSRSQPVGHARQHAAPASGFGGEHLTVLVIEDDPSLLSTLTYNLTRAGYAVHAAADGEAGLARAREAGKSLDLVILDVMLPGMNGFQVLRAIRVDLDVPVLMLSARGEEQDKIDGLELGADDYVVKPFALREFLARVRAVSRRRAVPAAKPAAVLYRGRLTIEPERRRALVDGKELALRPKEFGLLVTLALEPGKIFSRHRLLDDIWGEDIVVDERTVDVHISWLRGKLHKAGLPAETIQTIYRSGYRFALTGERAVFEPAAQLEPTI